LEYADKFLYSSPISDFMKIHSAVLELLDADRQTDRHAKLTGTLFAAFSCGHAYKRK
jgi:hypothetical protein